VITLDDGAVDDHRVHVDALRLERHVPVRVQQREGDGREIVLDQHQVRLLARRQTAQVVAVQGVRPTTGGPLDHVLGAQVRRGDGLPGHVRLEVLAGPIGAERAAHGREQIAAPPDAGVHRQGHRDVEPAHLPGGGIAIAVWCRCVSIMPGITIPPIASISSAPGGASSPTPIASTRSPTTSTSVPVSTLRPTSIGSTVPCRSTTVPSSATISSSRFFGRPSV
jgi:hypothetical protein